MIRYLLLTLCAGVLGCVVKTNAQCTITNFSATVTSVVPTPEGCQLTLDLSFTGNFNNGSKYAFIHLWETAAANNRPAINYGVPPTNANLAQTLANIVIADPGKAEASLKSTYPVAGQAGVPVAYSGLGMSKTAGNKFQITGLKVMSASCGNAFEIKGDVWSTQSTDGKVVGCSAPNAIAFAFTHPRVYGTLFCGRPRQFSITIDNTASTVGVSANYKVYWDDGDGMFEPAAASTASHNTTKDVQVYVTPAPLAVAGGALYVGPMTGYLPYSDQSTEATNILFIEAVTTSAAGSTTYSGVDIDNSCGTLPVKFKSFSANRNKANKQQVELAWATTAEQNNKGFYLQRKTDREWKDIAFVFSAADNGNSSTEQTYRYKDLNTHSGISQYRLLQVDMDGNTTYSDVKSLAGEVQKASMLVFPNPATGGKVNLVFAEAAPRQVVVSDLGGRIVKGFREVVQSSLSIDGLNSGFYTITVTDRNTAQVFVEKLVVRK